ncbi:MAG: carboxymuconolactone decarboxylase family protein [Actinobacteria bacterium]|nr:carboxymuconolactone decarboxylase family protein [Actinomycetota bacterium]
MTEIPPRLDIDARASRFSHALAHLDNATGKEVERVGFDARLRDLVRLRVSQVNGCAYCVDMHTKDLQAAGVPGEHLAALPVWPDAPFFDDRERAALAFAEAMTLMARDHVPAAVYVATAAHFDDDEMAALVALVVTINAWNAVGVSTRAWEVGSYQPAKESS